MYGETRTDADPELLELELTQGHLSLNMVVNLRLTPQSLEGLKPVFKFR